MWAAQNIDKIRPQACRDWAMSNFSLDKVADMYEEYFQMICDVHTTDGWYQLRPERKSLDWLSRTYPST